MSASFTVIYLTFLDYWKAGWNFGQDRFLSVFTPEVGWSRSWIEKISPALIPSKRIRQG